MHGLCALECFHPPELLATLLAQVARAPRLSLGDELDANLHQVALSLLCEPRAHAAFECVQSTPGLWEHCFQPAEVVGEAALADLSAIGGNDVAADVADVFARAAAARGWTVAASSHDVEGFYLVDAMLRARQADVDGASPLLVAVVVDAVAAPWLDRPSHASQRLKERHLSLWGLGVVRVGLRAWSGLAPSRRAALAARLLVDAPLVQTVAVPPPPSAADVAPGIGAVLSTEETIAARQRLAALYVTHSNGS